MFRSRHTARRGYARRERFPLLLQFFDPTAFSSRESVGCEKTELPFDLPQDQHAAIRRQLSTIKRGSDRFPPTGDRPGRNSVASVMMSGAFCWLRTVLFRQQNHT
jgi:hypothetical protein